MSGVDEDIVWLNATALSFEDSARKCTQLANDIGEKLARLEADAATLKASPAERSRREKFLGIYRRRQQSMTSQASYWTRKVEELRLLALELARTRAEKLS